MEIHLEHETDPDEKQRICASILPDLPMWFGIPESTAEYCRGVREREFVKAMDGDQVVGFMSIQSNNEFVSEIYVTGVLSSYHRRGVGRRLLACVESELAGTGVEYLEVKTLAEERESEEYRRTRLFYRGVGFIPLDVLRNEWGANLPCLILIKKLRNNGTKETSE